MAGAGHQKDTNSRVSPIWGPWACVQVITRFSVTPALPLLMRSEDGSAECFRLILPFDLLKLRVATLTLEVRSETTKKVRETGEHLSNGPPATLCPGISLGPVRAPRGERGTRLLIPRRDRPPTHLGNGTGPNGGRGGW